CGDEINRTIGEDPGARLLEKQSPLCLSGLLLLRRDDLRRLILQRMRQPAQHFFRADLPEAVAPTIPVVEDLVGPFAAGADRMFGDQRLELSFPPDRADPAENDAVE